MFGMIKKDIFMVKCNSKSLLFALVIYPFYTIAFNTDMLFLLPFMVVMISISTFSYDDFNNWHSFAATLPAGRKSIVIGRYISALMAIAVSTIMGFLISFVIFKMKGTIYSYSSYLTGSLCALIILISVMFPVLFKYGSEKGRNAMYIIGLSILIGTVFVKKVFGLKTIPLELTSFFDKYGALLISILSLIILFVSYKISKKIYSRREF